MSKDSLNQGESSLLEGYSEEEVKREIKCLRGYELNFGNGKKKMIDSIVNFKDVEDPNPLLDSFKNHFFRLHDQSLKVMSMIKEGSQRYNKVSVNLDNKKEIFRQVEQDFVNQFGAELEVTLSNKELDKADASAKPDKGADLKLKEEESETEDPEMEKRMTRLEARLEVWDEKLRLLETTAIQHVQDVPNAVKDYLQMAKEVERDVNEFLDNLRCHLEGLDLEHCHEMQNKFQNRIAQAVEDLNKVSKEAVNESRRPHQRSFADISRSFFNRTEFQDERHGQTSGNTERNFASNSRYANSGANAPQFDAFVPTGHHEFTFGGRPARNENPNRDTVDVQSVLRAIQSSTRKKIEVPNFSGKQTEDFDDFLSKFDTLVHKDKSASNETKLMYLLEALRGDARAYIKDYCSYDMSGANYEPARKILIEYYGGPDRKRIRSVLKLKEMPGLKKYCSSEFRSLHVKLLGIQRQKESEGNFSAVASRHSELFNIVLKKLGPFSKDYVRWIEDRKLTPSINSIVTWLAHEIQSSAMLESLEVMKVDDKPNNRANFADDSDGEEVSYAGADRKSDFECIACKDRNFHHLTKCKLFLAKNPRERFEIIKRNKCCINCLGKNHTVSQCKFPPNCKSCTKRPHHSLLHRTSKPIKSDSQEKTSANMAGEEEEELLINELFGSDSEDESENDGTVAKSPNPDGITNSAIQTALKSGYGFCVGILDMVVNIHYGDKTRKINLLQDSGCNNSNLRNKIRLEMKMKPTGETRSRKITVMTNKTVQVKSVPVEFEISAGTHCQEMERYGVQKNTRFTVRAYAIDYVCSGPDKLNWNSAKKTYDHLNDVVIGETVEGPIDLVLGTDMAGLIVPLDSRYHKSDMSAPVAVLTRIGWAIMGRCEALNMTESANVCMFNKFSIDQEQQFNLNTVEKDSNKDLFTLAERFWTLDEPGNNKKWSPLEEEAYEKMRLTYHPERKRFSAEIPWKEDNGIPNLTFNRNAVLQRQKRTLAPSYLKKKECSLPEIKACFQDLIDKNYVRLLENNEISNDSFYLPWFPVVKRNRESTQVRLVFDAAAKYNGTSLNNHVLTGPNLLTPFLKCLFRFRLRKYGYIGDISQMFLQMELSERDRKFFRVLFPDLDTGKVSDYEFLVTLFGCAAIPNISQKTLAENSRLHGENLKYAKDAIEESTYMDDILDSQDKEKEVAIAIGQHKELLSHCSMIPRKWLTNAKSVLKEIPEEERAKKALLGPDDPIGQGKVLGSLWLPEEDVLTFETSLSQFIEEDVWTKRKVLSTLFRLFDPDGKASPYTIIGKIILQKIVATRVDWDEKLEGPLVDEWKRWLSDANKISDIKIPRWLGFKAGAEMSIHAFSDASVDAIACVFYLVIKSDEGVRSVFLFSKARVTPNQALTIVKLELCALHLAVMWWIKFKEYNIFNCPTYFWVDSIDILYWLSCPAKHQKIFVANRVGEIQRHTKPDQFRHVPGSLNPADIPSRGMYIDELLKSSFFEGPDFIRQDKSSWPETKLQGKEPSDAALAENRKLTTFVNLEKGSSYLQCDASVGELWNGWKILLKRLRNLLRVVVAWTMFRAHKAGLALEQFQSLTLSDSELCESAKLLLFKGAQEDDFAEVKEHLEGQGLPRNHPLRKLCPFIDKLGIIRANSRLDKSELLPEEVRYPIILPTSHKITRLFVEHIHNSVKHPIGTNAMIAEINKFCIIPGLYKVERLVRKACVKCTKAAAKEAVPMMASIPSYRYSSPLKAFSQVGIDFTGSFAVKELKKLRSSRERPKMYVLVFSCLQTRAFHFETTDGMSTQDVYEALCRFSGRRGVPERIISDNYSTFKCVDKELQELFKQVDFADLEKSTSHGFLNSRGIKWQFSPPSGSHFGGIFETTVKAFKKAFYAIYKRAELTRSEFQTAVVECEYILNSRPIVTTKNDGETPALTPAHFLHGQIGGYSLCPPLKKQLNLYDRYRYLCQTLDHFWKRFIGEFMPKLHPRTKWCDEVPNVKEGDLVVHLDDQLPRGLWEIVVVQEVTRGEDGRIRQVFVKTKSGTVYKRPVCKLLPLPVQSRD